jgi:hypothetical protein
VAVIAASFRSPEAADALGRFWADRYQRCAVAVGRAVARGEIPACTDAHRLLMSATGPLYHQRMLLRQQLTRADADAYARAALAAVTATTGNDRNPGAH